MSHRCRAAILALLCGAAHANELDPITVTATRTAQSAFDVPVSIDAISIDPATADTPGVNPSEFMHGIPGLIARDRQNYAQDEQLSIRGFGARSSFGVRGVRLYVDGIPATLPDGQGQVSNFPLDAAQRIEVLRGPFSALYGNSSGGVIQIFSADGSDTPELRTGVSGGGYGTYRIAADAHGRDGALGYNVDFAHFYTDGYRGHGRAQRENGNAKFDLALGAERRLTVLVNTVALPDADDPLGLTRSQFQSDPRQPQPAAVQFDTRKSVHQNQLGAVYEQTLDAGELRVLGYAGTRGVEQFQAIPLAVQARPTSPGGVIDLDGNFDGADARWTWRGALAQRALEITIGSNYDRQNVHRYGYNNFSGSMLGVRGALRRDEQDDVWNLDEYVQADWNVAERWRLNAGARRSDVRFSVADRYITATNPDDSSHAAYAAATPVAGVLFRATPSWHLYAAYGNAFETPTFNELGYRPDGSAGLNFALLPARSRNDEFGSKWKLRDGGEFDIALFDANTRHELAVDTSGGGRTTYRNIDRARRRGVEAKLDLPLTQAWHVEAAYTYLDATFRAPFLACPAASACTKPNTLVAAGARIPGVPKTFAWAALRYRAVSGWRAALEATAASRTPVNDPNTESAPGYASFDLVGGRDFSCGDTQVSTFIRLNNLAGRRYAGSVIVNESNGRYYEPAPGRSLFAGITITR